MTEENKEKKQSKKNKQEEVATELAELKDKHLRLQADFDNYRKRMQKEKIEIIRYGNEDLLVHLLNVMDNFDRAIESADNTEDIKTLVDGIKFVQKQFHDALEGKGLTPIKCIGEKYDHNLHESIGAVESDEHEEDTIVEEFQKGYMLGDKVIRYPKVKIAKKQC